ncbi:MAG: hypothetical protein M3Y03_06695 [Verrucomicrobiota bacterium]|nr:hypothetical protein [Verrucomicrobiota bacterium]
MTPQDSFMILAAIDPAREGDLRALLDSMNSAPGETNPNNTVIPFAQFDRLHFARLLILDDKTITDVRVYKRIPRTYPLYLAFLGDIDGDTNSFLHELANRVPNGLRALYSCCTGFTSRTHLIGWMKKHGAPPIANYINWHGRSVQRVQEEAALRDALELYLQSNAGALTSQTPRELHAMLRRFVEGEKKAGRFTLSVEPRTPIGWTLRNLLHLVGVPLLFLLLSPLLLMVAPFFILRLRHLEKTDPELCARVDQSHSDNLAHREDHYVTNQFTAMGSLKPGFVRLGTTILVLTVVNYAARHIFTRGRLARIRTIHFARWVFLDRRKRMVFFSNYDGTVESYMDDFINKTGFGLNTVFSNGIGYPRTDWLVFGGCGDEQKYKNFLRRHTLPTQVWYKAYPGLTAIDLERNGRLRAGLETASMTEPEARDWAALL